MNNYNYYRSELKSKNISRYKMYGILAEIILDKSIFTRNEDLHPFLVNIINESYNDYVFRSRTNVVGRTIRYIEELEDKNYEQVRKKLLDFISEILNEKVELKKEKKNADFTKWMDGIKDDN